MIPLHSWRVFLVEVCFVFSPVLLHLWTLKLFYFASAFPLISLFQTNVQKQYCCCEVRTCLLFFLFIWSIITDSNTFVLWYLPRFWWERFFVLPVIFGEVSNQIISCFDLESAETLTLAFILLLFLQVLNIQFYFSAFWIPFSPQVSFKSTQLKVQFNFFFLCLIWLF